MEKRNIWTNPTSELEIHEDERGKIADVFFKKNIEHVAMITINKGAVRGNHYHKQTVQHILLTKGSLEYWYKLIDSNIDAKMIKVLPGDVITSSPMEIHTIRAIEDSEFLTLTEGIRGGKDYESDTFRVSSIIPNSLSK